VAPVVRIVSLIRFIFIFIPQVKNKINSLLFVFFLLTIVTLLDTKVVSLIPAHDEKNSIQPYAIKFDNNFLYVNGLLWVLQVSSNNKSYLHDITEIKDFLALSRVARFYATTEQKLIHSF
jgi:hypothetical protein